MSLRINSDFNGVTDPDAGAYIAAVEAADGNQLLEFAVGKAINDFVVGCKADGIWSAIKASCILAGARTLNGALVPLVGTAPTNNGPFVAGDYNRKTGLVGNGSTKYLNSNRAGNAAPQNSVHLSSYLTQPMVGGTETYLLGSQEGGNAILLLGGTASAVTAYINTSIPSTPSLSVSVSAANAVGFIGCDRSATSSSRLRVNGSNTVSANTSATPPSFPIAVFTRNINNSFNSFSGARLAFYSIGESLDLAKLDARVTALINAFGAAIP